MNRSFVTSGAALRASAAAAFAIAGLAAAVLAQQPAGRGSRGQPERPAPSIQPNSPLNPPANGPRRADPSWHALTNATVHVSPGKTIEHATVVIRDGRIVSVQGAPGPRGDGADASPAAPAGARVWDCAGLHVYPGFIDAYVEVDAPPPDKNAPGVHWNSRVTPQRRALDGTGLDAKAAEGLRKLGFTAAAITPRGGVFRGQAAVVSLAAPSSDTSIDRPPVYRDGAYQSVAFELSGNRRGGGGGGPPPAPDESRWSTYPDSEMGAIALIRQTLIDADWQEEARYYGASIGPSALDAIAEWTPPHRDGQAHGPSGAPLVFATDDELEALRAIKVAREFGRTPIVLGCGTEFRRLDAIREASRGKEAGPGGIHGAPGTPEVSFIIPLAFPRTPDVGTIGRADSVELSDLMTWEQAPTNARRLDAAGVKVALTTAKLRDRAQFGDNLQKALKHGLSPEHAMAMLTTTPAEMLGVADRLGTIEPGKQANLIVAEGDLFEAWPKKKEPAPSAKPETAKPETAKPEAGKPQAEKPDAKPTAQPIPPGEGQKPAAAEGEPERPAQPNAAEGARAEGAQGRGERGEKPDEDAAPKRARIRDVWVDGVRDEINTKPAMLAGAWSVEILGAPADAPPISLTIDDQNAISVEEGGKKTKAKGVKVEGTRFTFTVDDSELGHKGQSLVSGVIEGDALFGEALTNDGARVSWRATRKPPGTEKAQPEKKPDAKGDAAKDETKAKPDQPEGDEKAKPDGAPAKGRAPKPTREQEEKEAIAAIPEKYGYPFGPYMMDAVPPQQNILFTGATVWTSAKAGIIQNGVVFIAEGKISFVGSKSDWDSWLANKRLAGFTTVDCSGKHIAPGIIDCHSHTGISRGVNESGQAVTAEVRIQDVTDPDAISWYRQLGAGVTAVNSLHGSANAIGGQNCVNKNRWGCVAPDNMHFEGAMPGIKFALGENPKQSNWGDRMVTRYPQTRMGVETLIRDRFTAAREYARQSAGEPSRDRAYAEELKKDALARGVLPFHRDLELECLAEILAGKRLVHSHSYRQDELLMLCRVADDFGFKIGTLQHVLEGYKVADELATHARGASTFSDWWAYKVEVQDAIPQNGPIMREQGVVVSYNSDSDELARRLNSESGKAVKYGGISPEEALKFVTINPAIQLAIDGRVGSLEAGKDADLVIWGGPPVSIQSRPEATYVDGRCYFSLEQDAKHRERIASERHRLIQKVLVAAKYDRDRPEAGRPREGGLGGPWYTPTEEHALDLLNRGQDPAAAHQGECGCGED